MDVNSGFVRDPYGMVNMHEPPKNGGEKANFAEAQLALYRGVIERIRLAVAAEFGLEPDGLHFTAPTFVTRTVGNPDWRPLSMHDEYYHPQAATP